MTETRPEAAWPPSDDRASLEFGTGSGAYEWDPENDRLLWSPGLMRIYGLTRAPALEEGFTRLVHPNDRVRVEAETSAFLGSDAASYSHTFRIVRPDGEVRFVLDRGTIQRHADGRAKVIRGLNVDLTDLALPGERGAPPGAHMAADRPMIAAQRGADRERTSRQRDELEALYAEAPLGLGLLDRDLRFVRINAALAEINGFSVEEHLGRTAWDLLPDLRRSAEPALQRVLESGEPLRNVGITGQTAARPGVVRNWREHFYPLHGEGGEVEGIGIVCEEVTERLEAERALAESEERFRLALAGSPMTVFEHDTELRYRWLFNSQLGYSDTFAIGKTDEEIMDPEPARALMALLRRVMERGEPERREIIAAAPGKPMKHFDLHVHPRRDGAGRVVGLISVSTDMSERKEAEAALRAARDTFRHLVERSPFGIYAVDSDFRLVQVSEGAQKVFRNVRPLIGRDFAEVLRIIWPEPFAGEAIRRFRHTLTTGEAYHAPTTRERRADVGQTETYDWKIERITMPDGRAGVVCHFYDLSERQANEEKVELLMREVSHRSKNILALVDAIAKLTASAAEPETFHERFSSRIRALAASQDLLVQSEWEGADIFSLIGSQLSHFEDLLGRRILLDGPVLHVRPRAAQHLGMALHELATNATKYGALSDDEGSVTISWSVVDAEDGPDFTMSWVEADGPPVAAPEKPGFGHRVATSILTSTLGGEARLEYPARGLRWAVRCKLSALCEANLSS